MTAGDSPPEANSQPPAATSPVTVAVGVFLVAVVAFIASYHARRAPEGHGVLKAASNLGQRLRAQHRSRWADEVAAACAKDACVCAERAAIRGLDANLSAEVLALLESSAKDCPSRPATPGLRAEALTRAGQSEAGEREAKSVLEAAPRDAHALYARALGAWRGNRGPEALALSQSAVEAGRGASAYLLKGLIAYGSGQLPLAEASFRSMLELEPDDVDGVYDLALVHQAQNRYHLAREGYLQVLGLQPTRAEARFNLGVLAHSIEANAEAQHHLEKLRATSTDAALIAKLEAILATPVKTPRASASSPGFSLVRGASSAPAPTPPAPAAPTPPPP